MTEQQEKAMRMALEAFEMYLQHSTKEMIFNQISTARAETLRQALAQPEQKPVAWINYNAATGEETINRECHSELASTPLYRAPPKREWVGLTHEERFLNDCRSPEEIEYAIAIEAKLKDKNT